MKWSYATLGVIVLGIIGISIILLFQELTTSSENDYYLLKEITEAAMIDSIDMSYYRGDGSGELKIVKEKFVENFTRRFAESTLAIGSTYTISFFDIMERPPKVTISITTGINNYRIYDDVDSYKVENTLTGILEYYNKNVETTTEDVNNLNKLYQHSPNKLNKTYYSNPSLSDGEKVVNQPINYPEELSSIEIRNVRLDLKGSSVTNNLGDILITKINREIDWATATENSDSKTKYYDEIDTSKYASNCNIKNFAYYNCGVDANEHVANERKKDGMCVSPYDKNIWFYYEVDNCSKTEQAIIKLDTEWTYDEYEFEYK